MGAHGFALFAAGDVLFGLLSKKLEVLRRLKWISDGLEFGPSGKWLNSAFSMVFP
jgi:hypothetical protein